MRPTSPLSLGNSNDRIRWEYLENMAYAFPQVRHLASEYPMLASLANYSLIWLVEGATIWHAGDSWFHPLHLHDSRIRNISTVACSHRTADGSSRRSESISHLRDRTYNEYELLIRSNQTSLGVGLKWDVISYRKTMARRIIVVQSDRSFFLSHGLI